MKQKYGQRTNRKNHGKRRGVALVGALVASFVAAAMIAAIMLLSLSNNQIVQVDRHRVQARYRAEGALANASKELQEAVANWRPVPVTSTVSINGQDVTCSITPTGLDTIITDGAGIQTLVTGYEVVALGQSEGSQEPMSRILNVEATPIFQFAAFYTSDLEFHPGPNMRLSGRVHTNGDLYIGCGGTLTVNTNYLGAVGSIYRDRKDSPGNSNGTVQVRRWVENPFDSSEPAEFVNLYSQSQMTALGVTTTSGYDSAFTSGLDLNGDGDFDDTGEWLPFGPGALEFWSEPTGYLGGSGYTVQTSEHHLTEASVPGMGSIAMFEASTEGDYNMDTSTGEYIAVAAGTGAYNKGFFHENADLSIITYSDGTWDAFNSVGTSVKASLTSVVTTDTMYDARQSEGTGNNTPITTIDIDALNNSGMFPANGLLYASHYGLGSGTDAKGVVLTNGATLKNGLTVVSDGSVYVHGDYNTTDKVGASVIGDAVNLLSNSWDWTKTPGNMPAASETTFNVAIVTGNTETTVGHYNGGLENLPRFHENWSGISCNIVGSFVNSWHSTYATGAWGGSSDIYKAPTRNWSYDPDFNTVANLPPFTPMVVTASDVVTW